MKFLLMLLVLFVTLSCTNHKTIKRLQLIKAYEVQTNNSIEPSGLTEWDGEFYTVSDKHNYIYQLIFNGDSIQLDPIIEIRNDKDRKLDLEGITHDDKYFYLISEMHFQVMKVSKDGKTQSWMPATNQLKKAGLQVGLFENRNAYFEGICLLNENKFLLAAERQPRGFVEYNFNSNKIKAYQQNKSIFSYEDNRSVDFAGLSCIDGLYVLERNAFMVAELINKKGQYQEGNGYSYEHIINKPHLQYQDKQYGQAEGLVVKGNKVYIILDNNRNYHQQNPENNNSLFLELKK